MNAPDASPAPPAYKDRHAGLVAFGIVQIILGGFIALMIPLIFFAQHIAARQQAGAVYPPSLAFVLAVYGTLAMVLVCLGIGSIMTRRWARALTLVGAWSWLIIGVFSMAFQIVLLPRVLATPGPTGATMPHAALAAMMVTMLVVLGIVFIALPAIFVWFYGSRHVKATCEARNPRPSWTDGCPLPLLALCLWLASGAIGMLAMPLAGMSALPLFGKLVTGPGAALAFVLLAVAWAWAAWATYRRQLAGWWFIFIALIVFAASCLVTFLRVDPLEMYRVMGYPEQQIEQMRSLGFLTGPTMAWLSAGGAGLWLVLLLWVRRYFKPASVPPKPTPSVADGPAQP
jgi:hypothetical protein